MLISILLIPVFAALGVLVFPKKYSAWTALSGSAVTFGLSIFILIQILNGRILQHEMSGLPGMPFLLKTGHFNAVVLMAVTSVAFFIFIFGKGYMAGEPGKKAFWSGMSLFLAAMELLVMSGDWVSFIVGWEVMGFASYRLIATWHPKKEAQEGAAKAFMITRITDMGLYIGIFLIILSTGSSRIGAGSQPVSTVAGFALLFAVMGKSAQVPFQSWLSGAMAGPTPVSSFLHSATLVAAGVILMLKSFPLLPSGILPWIGAVGGVTILLAGLTAVFSTDLKQMLAASTSSHLGFMLLAIGAGYPGAAAAHLLAHAFMKSSLFLGAGIWQHAFESTSFEKLKSAGKNFQFTFLLFTISAVALAGIPPLIGYFSKDAILAAGLKANAATFYFATAVAGAVLTAVYMGRALHLLRKSKNETVHKTGGIRYMQTGMAVLVTVVLGAGFFLKPAIHFIHLEMPHATAAIISGIAAAILGLTAGWLFLSKSFKGKTAAFIRNNYSIAGGYQHLVVEPFLKLARFFNRIETGIDYSVQFSGKFFYGFSTQLFRLDKVVGNLVQAVGRINLQVGRLTRLSDESGLDQFIQSISQYVKNLGSESRKLQNGLVHREMLLSVIGFIGFILILIVLNL